MEYLCVPAPLTMKRRLDLRAAKAFGKPHESGGGEVALVVQNVFRDSYTEHSAVPGASGKIIYNGCAYLMASLDF